jgi:hypothetical protein
MAGACESGAAEVHARLLRTLDPPGAQRELPF